MRNPEKTFNEEVKEWRMLSSTGQSDPDPDPDLDLADNTVVKLLSD